MPLAKEDLERVRAAIEAAERRTAGEICVVIARSSTGLALALGSLAGALATAAAYLVLAHRAWGFPTWREALAAVAIGLGAALVVALAAGRLRPAGAVRRRAEAQFERLGIAKTAGRTGVLILVSLREHRAVLLADRAIDEKVPAGTWDAIVARIAAAARERRLGAGLVEAVAEVGRILAEHFPRAEGDVNELPDEVVTS